MNKMPLMKILLIEDDESLVEVLRQSLVKQHYSVEVAIDGQAGWELAIAFEYDLILLDLVLPKLDGIKFCQQLRTETYFSLRSPNHHTPILLMTAEDASVSKVTGLDAGADDYIVKPFDLEELLARIRALLRRGYAERLPLLEWQALQLNPSICEVRYDGQLIPLTAKEYKLLELLLRHPQRIFSHTKLIEHLWALDQIPTDNAIRAHVKGLRKKLKDIGVEDCIETVYGLGYRLREVLKGKAEQAGKEKRDARSPQSGKVEDSVASELNVDSIAAIQNIWAQARQSYGDRVAVIEQAVLALGKQDLTQGKQDLTQALHQQAQQEAHTLAGSLGMFGLNEASRLSRKIEQIFKGLEILEQQKESLAELVSQLQQELQRPFLIASSVSEVQSHPVSSQNWTIHTPQQPLRLLVVDDDAVLANQLRQAARARTLQVEVATNLTQARAMIAQCAPDGILLDLNFPDSTQGGFELLNELTEQQPQIPVLVLTAQESFADRVRVAQLGGKGFLQKPIALEQVIETVLRVVQHPIVTEARILVIDDDLHLLENLRSILEPWGFHLTLLNGPQHFWYTLETAQPDLLILDIEMPEFNGIDLCQVVRNDVRWGELPILFLSAHLNDDTLHQVFMAGADDYVSKPIRATELVARVLNRLKWKTMLQKFRESGGQTSC